MPDIQTEMQKILQAWEEPETTEQPKETTVFKPTNNVSKQTFESIRDFSGEPTRFHIDRLVRQGHKKSSVGSLIGQMIRQGRVYKDMDGLLRPNAKEYTPLKTSKVVAKQAKKPKTLKVKTSKQNAEALEAAAEAMGGINMLIDHSHTPAYRSKLDDLLDDISLNDAHELYRRLHLYFGGLGK
jgi:hypothetical protein